MRYGVSALAFAVVGMLAVGSAEARIDGGYYSINGELVLADKNTIVVGVTEADMAFDPGYALTASAGYAYKTGFRSELELGYKHVPGDVDLSVITVIGSAFFDLKTTLAVDPYFGAGIGIAHTDRTNVTVGSTRIENDPRNDLTLFVEAGVAIPIEGRRLRLTPNYRYQWIGNGDGYFEDDQAHLFRIGLQFGF